MINVNEYTGLNDNEVIENAINNKDNDGIVIIPPRKSEIEPERTFWLLDRAILIPENTTIILQNCTIKLSDKCRDNFFRTANCGMGIDEPEKIKNIHIKGEGVCILQGADHPRATGDGGKLISCPCPYDDEDILAVAHWISEDKRQSGNLSFWDKHEHSYGTDFGKENESQYGDWRGIGILFANTEDFSIENIRIVESHGWGISLEACAYGRVEKIDFDACMSKVIDGMRQNMENQDGIDIRNGCHHITISDISGHTGDDVVALTAIASPILRKGGVLKSTHVMGSDWSKRERDIHDIIIRNVKAYSNLCYTVRLLPANAKIYNIVIDGIIDTSTDTVACNGCILLGEADGAYGENPKDGMRFITISNVISNSKKAIIVAGYISDSVISNVVNRNPECPCISLQRENGMKNVKTANLCSLGEDIAYEAEKGNDVP